jgi:transposase
LKSSRAEQPTAGVLDSQSIKAPGAAQRGYDAGKKVSGIKRHIAVDSQGRPHAMEVTTADVNDRKGTLLMFVLKADALPDGTQVLADAGYAGVWFEQQVGHALGANVQSARRNAVHQFVVIPKRWIVERSFAWPEKCRRLWKNCERQLHASLQFVVLAFVAPC